MDKTIELLQVNTDGGSRGNPGQAAIGVYAQDEGKVVFSLSEKIGITTNNVAEYTAVLRALEEIERMSIFSEKIKFVLDSELIVRQITGVYKIKQPHLKEIHQKISEISTKLREKGIIKLMAFTIVRREFNKEADKLVNLALDKT